MIPNLDHIVRDFAREWAQLLGVALRTLLENEHRHSGHVVILWP